MKREARSTTCRTSRMRINYIYGLGGRDITVEDYYEIYNDLFIINETDDPGDVYRYVGVRDSRYGERGFDHRKYEE